MKTIRFQISDEDYAILSEIAAVFYEGCTRGGRPLDIQDLARYSLLGCRRSMHWALNKGRMKRGGGYGELPGNVTAGPWNGGKAKA